MNPDRSYYFLGWPADVPSGFRAAKIRQAVHGGPALPGEQIVTLGRRRAALQVRRPAGPEACEHDHRNSIVTCRFSDPQPMFRTTWSLHFNEKKRGKKNNNSSVLYWVRSVGTQCRGDFSSVRSVLSSFFYEIVEIMTAAAYRQTLGGSRCSVIRVQATLDNISPLKKSSTKVRLCAAGRDRRVVLFHSI